MNRAGRWIGACLVLSTLVVAPLVAAEAAAASQIDAEIQRLEEAWRQTTPSDHNLDGIVSASRDALHSAKDALRAGRLLLAMESLARATDLYYGVREIVAKSSEMNGGMAAFEAEWAKASREVADRSGISRAKNWSASPASVRALAETALGRTGPLLDGGRGFATATGPRDGLLYIGEARGQAEFAAFCAALRLAGAKRGWVPRSLLPELLELQEKADAAFQPPRSVDQHSRFIALNSSIKLARELDAAKSYYGALYQYLEAVRHYGMLDAPAVGAERRAELKSAIGEEIRKGSKAGRDDSIPQIFLERTAAQIVHADGSDSTADEWRTAGVVLTKVLPAYATVLKSAPRLRTNGDRTISVTLVRWPYT